MLSPVFQAKLERSSRPKIAGSDRQRLYRLVVVRAPLRNLCSDERGRVS